MDVQTARNYLEKCKSCNFVSPTSGCLFRQTTTKEHKIAALSGKAVDLTYMKHSVANMILEKGVYWLNNSAWAETATLLNQPCQQYQEKVA